MSSKVLMHTAAGFPKTFSWLLAVALTVQPVAGIPCACNAQGHDAAAGRTKQRCCGCSCCRGAAHGCPKCSASRRSCCRHLAGDNKAAGPAAVCNCGANRPSAPPSVPPARSAADEVVISALGAPLVAAEMPAICSPSWAVDAPAAFGSAAQHCVALCRLQL